MGLNEPTCAQMTLNKLKFGQNVPNKRNQLKIISTTYGGE